MSATIACAASPLDALGRPLRDLQLSGRRALPMQLARYGSGAPTATVHDMCKALSHAIVIGPARLTGKRGGKRDVGRIE